MNSGAYLVTGVGSADLHRSAVSPVRTPGSITSRLLRRPDGLDQATWLTCWQRDQQVAIEAQATLAATQNWWHEPPHPRGTGESRALSKSYVSRGGDNRSGKPSRSR